MKLVKSYRLTLTFPLPYSKVNSQEIKVVISQNFPRQLFAHTDWLFTLAILIVVLNIISIIG